MKTTMQTTVLTVVLILTATSLCAKEYHLYFLAGQSNMVGYGKKMKIEKKYQSTIGGVMIFHGNDSQDGEDLDGRGIWSKLQPGHGNWSHSDGKNNKYSSRFGPELFFGIQMKELYPDRNIALVKYARNGSSLAIEAAAKPGCWDPEYNEGNGINQYDHALAALSNARAIEDIDGDGESDTLIPSGIVWMQGESDANHSEEIAEKYSANLKRLMDQVRKDMDDKSVIPIVIGRISNSKDAPKPAKRSIRWKHSETLRAQQEAYAKDDKCAAMVTTTDNYAYSDPFHYDTAGFKDLGIQFAEEMKKLEDKISGSASNK
jgi:iduronate 2-sulfatase